MGGCIASRACRTCVRNACKQSFRTEGEEERGHGLAHRCNLHSPCSPPPFPSPQDPLAATFELENFVSSVASTSNAGDGGRHNGGAVDQTVAADGGEGLVHSTGFDQSFSAGEDGESGGGGVGGGALLKGDLATRPKSGGDGPWRPAHYVLEKGRLLVFEDRHHVRPKQVRG